MSTLEQLYAQADKRRADNQLPYAGALSPAEAFEMLQLDPRVRIVDVRTRAELDWVGRPLAGDGQYAHVEWTRYPGAVPNPDFIEQVRQVASDDTPLLLLCRSAARSKLAAIAVTQAGFTKAYDILEGFEGDKDGQGHRKTVS
ncbi:MAG: rhodanese-like domain-containing protein, partial [Acetobacteraceae bacterium]|nr:rhodanese-like domain-containing protein [Acetobacteraceae bacterium]